MIDGPTLAQLWNAAHVCDDCGTAWGTPRPDPEHVTRWHGTCHLCGLELGVSHVRHYGYLRRGLAIVQGRDRQPAPAASNA
jgi:hypothetical protein